MLYYKYFLRQHLKKSYIYIPANSFFNLQFFVCMLRKYFPTTVHIAFTCFVNNCFFVACFLLFLNCLQAQENASFVLPDSLQQKTFKELRTAFEKGQTDSLQKVLYAESYLAKAIKEKDTFNMATGYEFLGKAFRNDLHKSFGFFDKGISITKVLQNERYPAIFYTFKGAVLYGEGAYPASLDNYLKALDAAEKNNNTELIYVNKYNIGILRKRVEQYKEALDIYKECYVYEKNNPEKDTLDFIRTHLALASLYIETKQLDSAAFYLDKGKRMTALTKDTQLKNLFILTEGIHLFYETQYLNAIDSIQKTLPTLLNHSDKSYMINAYFHLGKAHDFLKQKETAVQYYQKVDSIFSMHTNFISTKVIDNYDALYRYYKSKNDIHKQLHYTNRKLFSDSILDSNYKYLSTTISKKYDRRLLLSEKEKLNEALHKKDRKFSVFLKIAGALFTVCIFLVALFYYKQQRLKRRFQEFVTQHQRTQKDTFTVTRQVEATEETIGIPQEIIDHLLQQLANFEKESDYIDSDITLTGLAKRFKTNSAYLSKVINTFKHKKFAEYLNDLRVAYAIDKIQNDKHFSLYTIKAIALEVGFNNSQSFARAFKRKTKMQPSDFIKQLKNSTS